MRATLACLIYTSGTGGAPKGVMLPHRAILSNCRGAFELMRSLRLRDETYLSYLPVSHSYEHTVGMFFLPSIGTEIVYCRGVEHLAADMLTVRPTILTAVPRVLEVIRARVLTQVAREPQWRQRLFDRALAPRAETRGPRASGRRRTCARLGARRPGPHEGSQPFRRPPEGGHVRWCAPRARGRQILPRTRTEGHAGLRTDRGRPGDQCQSSRRHLHRYRRAGAARRRSAYRRGRGDPGARRSGDEWLLGPADATALAIQDDWLHTGDVGALDNAGYLRILDRKKDMIVLSGGENVSPAKVEGMLMAEPEIAQAVVAGDGRSSLTALVVPAAAATMSLSRLAVNRVNLRLSITERIRRHAIVSQFTVENGLLTPTQKIRRMLVIRANRNVLARLHA